jgi:hypothetical protein
MKSAAPVGALALIAALGAFAARAQIAQTDRKSGSAFMSAQTQEMQRDDGANPAMLAARFERELGTKLTPIGRILQSGPESAGSRVRLRDGSSIDGRTLGYEHGTTKGDA